MKNYCLAEPDEFRDLRNGGLRTHAYHEDENGSQSLPEPKPRALNKFHSKLEAEKTATFDEHT